MYANHQGTTQPLSTDQAPVKQHKSRQKSGTNKNASSSRKNDSNQKRKVSTEIIKPDVDTYDQITITFTLSSDAYNNLLKLRRFKTKRFTTIYQGKALPNVREIMRCIVQEKLDEAIASGEIQPTIQLDRIRQIIIGKHLNQANALLQDYFQIKVLYNDRYSLLDQRKLNKDEDISADKLIQLINAFAKPNNPSSKRMIRLYEKLLDQIQFDPTYNSRRLWVVLEKGIITNVLCKG